MLGSATFRPATDMTTMTSERHMIPSRNHRRRKITGSSCKRSAGAAASSGIWQRPFDTDEVRFPTPVQDRHGSDGFAPSRRPVGSTAMSNAAQFIFTMRKVSRFHPPDKEVVKEMTLAFYPGAKIGVIGPNGPGKPPLLGIRAGGDAGFPGGARLSPGFTVGLLEQEPHLDPAKDVKANVMDGVGAVADLLTKYDEVLARYADPDADYEKIGEEQARLEAEIEAKGANDLERQIEIAMDALRLPPGDAAVDNLSGGERRRVALCRLLLSKPDLLLLDEPTNHLDAESVAWLERSLQEYPGTVVAITHDRYFLDNVAKWILELANGRGTPFEGNYSGWLEQTQERLRLEQKADSARAKTLERELEWVRMGAKARHAKSKARIDAYDKLFA